MASEAEASPFLEITFKMMCLLVQQVAEIHKYERVHLDARIWKYVLTLFAPDTEIHIKDKETSACHDKNLPLAKVCKSVQLTSMSTVRRVVSNV